MLIVWSRFYGMRPQISKVFARPMNFMFMLSFVACVIMILIAAVDPLGLEQIYPPVVAMILVSLLLPTLSTMVKVQLVNIMSVRDEAVYRIQQENMFRTINRNYKGVDVSVDAALVWKRKYVVVGSCITLVEWTGSIISGVLIGLEHPAARLYWVVWWCSIWIWFIVRGVIFFVYLQRFVSLMESRTVERQRDIKLMRIIGVQQIVMIVSWIVLTIILQFVRRPDVFIVTLLLFSFIIIATIIVNLLPYIDFGAKKAQEAVLSASGIRARRSASNASRPEIHV